jgi:hypothetical protein
MASDIIGVKEMWKEDKEARRMKLEANGKRYGG